MESCDECQPGKGRKTADDVLLTVPNFLMAVTKSSLCSVMPIATYMPAYAVKMI